jgi:hypothetical protein
MLVESVYRGQPSMSRIRQLRRRLFGFFAERPIHFSRRGHRTIGVTGGGLLLRNGSTASLMRGVSIPGVLERLFADAAGSVLGLGRPCVDRRKAVSLFVFLAGRLSVADTSGSSGSRCRVVCMSGQQFPLRCQPIVYVSPIHLATAHEAFVCSALDLVSRWLPFVRLESVHARTPWSSFDFPERYMQLESALGRW